MLRTSTVESTVESTVDSGCLTERSDDNARQKQADGGAD